MRVSVITVCFNSAATIRDTIESVLTQDYKDIEYIIIDGGSTDQTLQIVSEYKHCISKFITEPDRGIYDAMNKGIRLASGDVVGMLNSDDVYISETAISELMGAMNSSGADAVYADLIIVDPVRTDKVLRYYSSKHFTIAKFRYGWMPAHPTFFVKKSAYDVAGLFSTTFRIAADFDMLLRLLLVHKVSSIYYPKSIVRMRAGGISTSGLINKIKLNLEIIQSCRSNGVHTNTFLIASKLPRKLLEFFKRQ
jgi:glycosyltransferase involved in cell wall biosynthesis